MTTICQSKIDVVACQVAWHEKFVLSPAAFFSAVTPLQVTTLAVIWMNQSSLVSCAPNTARGLDGWLLA